MPKFDHFITRQEFDSIEYAHNILQGEDREWYEAEVKRITDTTGYRLSSRSSGDSALRLFLIARKGYTLEQAMDLRNLTAQQYRDLFQEFSQTIADPNKTRQENLFELGKLHKEALEKISS